MRLCKIRNRYMYNGDNPDGYHDYVVFEDEKTKELCAVQLTHLYEPRKVQKIEQGYLKVEKFADRKYPSGVHRQVRRKDAKEKPISLSSKDVQVISSVPKKQADRIKQFVSLKTSFGRNRDKKK